MQEIQNDNFELDFFLRSVLDDLSGIGPSLGCEVTGKVNYTEATASGQFNSHKNQLIIFFAEVAQRLDKLHLIIDLEPAGKHWSLNFSFDPGDMDLSQLPYWDPRFYQEIPRGGFSYLVLKEENKKELPVMLYDKALEVFTLPDLLEEALEDFRARTAQRIEKIGQALEESDHQEIQRNAHGIKGAARNLFAKQIAKWAWNMERDAREEASMDTLSSHFQRLNEVYQVFLEWKKDEQ